MFHVKHCEVPGAIVSRETLVLDEPAKTELNGRGST
jgi:hypothetical protein